jgi:hypothetical protein
VPSGGTGRGQGRKRKLSAEQCAEIKRDYAQKMKAWAISAAYLKDPKVRANLELDRKIAWKISRQGRAPTEEELISPLGSDVPILTGLQSKLFDRIPKADVEKLVVDRRRAGTPDLKSIPDKEARGARDRFIQELAQEHNVTPRAIFTCLNRKT